MSVAGEGQARPRLAIALVSASALALQVALTRLLSVTLWYHFAFLIVSTALLGYGLAGALLALRRAGEGQNTRLARAAAAQALTALGAPLALRVLPFEPFRLAAEPLQLLWAAALQLALVAPFLASGLAVGMLLTGVRRGVGRLYAADLLGAAAGAVGALFALPALGPTLVCGAAASCAALGGAGLARPAARRRHLALALLVWPLAWLLSPSVVGLRVAGDKRLGTEPVAGILADPTRHEAGAWDLAARLDLIRSGTARSILLDAGAALVRVPHLTRPWAQTPPLRDATSLPFFVDAPRRVLVLGAGAGWEVAGALSHGATKVTAVEVAGTLSRWLRGRLGPYTRHLIDDPRVQWVDGEARTFVRGSGERWDHILSIHTISNAAASSGAMNLAESHTLTVEAIEEAIAHLDERGWLYLTRPEVQLPKLIATCAQALRARGLDPSRHLAALRWPEPGAPADRPSFTAGVLVGASPIDVGARPRVEAAARRVGMDLVLAPWLGASRRDLLAALQGRSPAGADPAAFTPATDDRPFFHRRRSWSRLRLADLLSTFTAGARARRTLEDRPLAEISLALLLAETLLIAALATWLAARRRRRAGRTRLPLSAAAYFTLLGLGYAAVELGLIHRLGLLLGHPSRTFVVCVAGLLLASGLGSALFARRPALGRPRWLFLCALGIALAIPLAGGIDAWLLGTSLPSRIAGALGIVLPLGIVLGVPFPSGLAKLETAGEGARALAFGLNGFAAVAGASLSIVIASGAGLRALLLLAALAYLLAAACLRRWSTRAGL